MQTYTVGYRGREITVVADDTVQDLAARIYEVADEEDGTLQAQQMVELFPGQPTLHTTTPLFVALMHAGCMEMA